MARSLPLISLQGAPREWGLQHGRAVRAQVAKNIAAYFQRFEAWGVPRDEVRRRAEAYRRVIQEANPGYAAAMEGIAESSGQDGLDVAAVNVRYEILYSAFAERGKEDRLPPLAAGCTSFAVLPSRAANGHLLIGQNWDWIPEVQGLLVQARSEAGDRQLAFTEAGIPGAKIGLNSHGLGLAVNGLVSNLDSWARLRKPFHVRCWEVLAASTLEGAERAVAGVARACSANFLLAQAGNGGRVVDLEAAPEGVNRVNASDGVLVHTNHFLDPGALGVWQPLVSEDRPSTQRRLARMEAMFRAFADRGQDVGIEDLKGMLRDHENTPYSVCRHPDLRFPEHDRYETVVSAIMDLDAREMYIASGTPCTARYRRVTLMAD